MNEYLVVKWLHILSSTLLFGTGIGSAFYLLVSVLQRDTRVVAGVARIVVIADWLFTATTVIAQPLTGLYMVHLAGMPLGTRWLAWSMVLYAIAVACWLPVVWLQLRIRDLLDAKVAGGTIDEARLRRYFRWWFALGWPAFAGLVVVFWLMVAKPA